MLSLMGGDEVPLISLVVVLIVVGVLLALSFAV